MTALLIGIAVVVVSVLAVCRMRYLAPTRNAPSVPLMAPDPRPTVWEHRVVEVNPHACSLDFGTMLSMELKPLGDEGFELVTAISRPQEAEYSLFLIFKRRWG